MDRKDKILHLVEISPHIYAGAVNDYAAITAPPRRGPSGHYTPTIKTGGVAFLFNKVRLLMEKSSIDIVFVADRAPTIKRAISDDFKVNRGTRDTTSVDSQKDIAEYVLADCGFTVLSEEGYEADDLLYGYSLKYKKEYKDVVVHSDDSDNFICCDTNVFIYPARNKGKFISKDNFETTVKSDRIIPWNTMTFYNLLHGKPANDLRALPRADQDLLLKAYGKTMFHGILGKPHIVLPQMMQMNERISIAAQLAYPLALPDDPKLQVSTPDWDRCKAWGYVLGSSEFRNKPSHPVDLTSELEALFQKGYQVN